MRSKIIVYYLLLLSGEYDYRITGVGIDFGYLSIIGLVKLNLQLFQCY